MTTSFFFEEIQVFFYFCGNLIITGNDLSKILQLKINDLGKLHYFLGLKILYGEGGVIMSLRKFVLNLHKEYGCLQYSSFSSPLDPTVKLRAKEATALSDPTSYRKLVGKLNFLVNTKLDISYDVQT